MTRHAPALIYYPTRVRLSIGSPLRLSAAQWQSLVYRHRGDRRSCLSYKLQHTHQCKETDVGLSPARYPRQKGGLSKHDIHSEDAEPGLSDAGPYCLHPEQGKGAVGGNVSAAAHRVTPPATDTVKGVLTSDHPTSGGVRQRHMASDSLW